MGGFQQQDNDAESISLRVYSGSTRFTHHQYDGCSDDWDITHSDPIHDVR